MRRLPQIAPRLGQWTGDGLTPNYFARISVLGFGFTALAASFTIVILPTRVLDFAPEESKNTYLGILSFVGLLIAVAVQPIAGGFSDRLRSRWGRRRPFIVGGTVASLPLLVAAGVAPTYVLLFLFICLLQLASNVAMGPYQALVRDLVPGRRRGAASGMKMLVEVVGAMTLTGLVALLVGPLLGRRQCSMGPRFGPVVGGGDGNRRGRHDPLHCSAFARRGRAPTGGARLREGPPGLPMVPPLPILRRNRGGLAPDICPVLSQGLRWPEEPGGRPGPPHPCGGGDRPVNRVPCGPPHGSVWPEVGDGRRDGHGRTGGRSF